MRRLLCVLGLHRWTKWEDLDGDYSPIGRRCPSCGRCEVKTVWDGWNP